MSIETQLREALTSHAASIESVEAHPYERVAGAITKNRTRRRTVGAAAVAAVAAIAIGVPAVTSRFADTATSPAGHSRTLPPATDKAWKSVTTWPLRGSLAGDSGFVDAVAKQFDGRPVFVEDVGERRVAVVVSHADLIVGVGPRGAAATDLTRASSGPIAEGGEGVVSFVGPSGLIVLTTPDRTSYEVSRTPDIALDGTVTRRWQKLPLEAGVGRTSAAGVPTVRIGTHAGPPTLGFVDDKVAESDTPCPDDCATDPESTQERETNSDIARVLDLTPSAITTRTVFNAQVPPAFGTWDGMPTGNALLHVMHTTLPNGAILRTAWLRSDEASQSIEMGRPIDARRTDTIPIVQVAEGDGSASSTRVAVLALSGSAVRAVGDPSSPSSGAVAFTNHVATFEVPVSLGTFRSSYRIEVLRAGKVVDTVRMTHEPTNLFELMQGAAQ